MQVFRDKQTGQEYHFEDDVIAKKDGSNYEFYMLGEQGEEIRLAVPATLEPLAWEEESPALLQKARDEKGQELRARYQSEAQRVVECYGGAFEADFETQEILHNLLSATDGGQELGSQFLWQTADGEEVALAPHELREVAYIMSMRRLEAYKKLRQAQSKLATAATTKEINAL